MKQIWIDTETGGLDPVNSALLQLAGFIIIDGEFKEYFNIRIQQPPNKIIEPKALEVHKLDPNEGVPLFRAYLDFISILEKYISKFDADDKLQIFGYGVKFDVDFLRQFFLDNNDKFFGSYFWHPPVCVMTLAANKLSSIRYKLPNFKLTTLCEYFNIDIDNAHDALADITATHALYERLENIEC